MYGEDMDALALQPLPEGRVTLVFVEITGSAALWETQTAQIRHVSEEWETVWASNLALHEGRQVKTLGDNASLSVFLSVGDALTALRVAWTRFYREHWPSAFTGHGLRAAVITGTPITAHNDYFGPLVNRCARILELASAWQILLPQEAAREIDLAALSEMSLSSFGEGRLRNIEEPVSLWEARIAALPLSTELSRPPAVHSLPATFTAFIGREGERKRLRALLRDSQKPLVTMLGPGGCGKTRLAIELLHEVEGDYPDGVWFLPLSYALTADALITQIAQAVGLPLAGGADSIPMEALCTFLRDRRGLLALDGFERLTPHRALLSELLRAAPHLKCLVTSRVRLRLPEETTFTLPPLKEEEAIALLRDRIQQISATVEETPTNAATLSEICRQLDGLPLSLELAAPLLRGFSPTQLLARMRQRKLDFAVSRHNPEARHRTLRQCLDWSCETLSEDERRLFARLSVFAGDFSTEAAQIVCGEMPSEYVGSERVGADEVRIGIETLRDSSLLLAVETPDGERWHMLELIREYAQERLRADEAEMEEVRTRHARYFADIVAEARGRFTTRGESDYFRVCQREMENIRVGMIWAQNSGEHSLFARYAHNLAIYFIEQERWQEYRLCAPLAMRYLREAGDWSALARMHNANAQLARRAGDFDTAVQELEQALERSRQTKDARTECEAIYNLGLTLRDRGDGKGAKTNFLEAQRLARTLGYALMEDIALTGLGELALDDGDANRAKRLYQEARTRFARRGETLGAANAHVGLARVAIAGGEWSLAYDYLRESLRVWARTGERYATLNALYAIAHLLLCVCAYEAAVPLLRFLKTELAALDSTLKRRVELDWEECRGHRGREAEKDTSDRLHTLEDALSYAEGVRLWNAFASSITV